jgi:hypothetical protein
MGKVYLIGAGPGAADLITLRGAELLRRADVVFHDALVQPELLALAPQARKVAVGKRCSRVSTEQRFINRSLVEAASKHEVVVRLKGGDPMLFGRAQEEIDALRAANVPFEVVRDFRIGGERTARRVADPPGRKPQRRVRHRACRGRRGRRRLGASRGPCGQRGALYGRGTGRAHRGNPG